MITHRNLKIVCDSLISSLVGFSLTAKPNKNLDDLYCGKNPVMLERGRANELAAIVEQYITQRKNDGVFVVYSLNSFNSTESLNLNQSEIPLSDFSYDDSIGLTPEYLEDDGSVLATAQFFSEAMPSNVSGQADLKCYVRINNQHSFCDTAAPLAGEVESCELIPVVESLPSIFPEELIN